VRLLKNVDYMVIADETMNPEYLIDEYEKIYPEKDYHTLYFGEILACYDLE